MMALVDEKVSYLEMHAPCSRYLSAPREGLGVVHAKNPTVAFYRFLYNTVGNEYHWRSRAQLSDSDLASILRDPLDEVHVLHVDGTPAGFAELDRRVKDDIELVHFGLMADFIGQGLGRYFLQWTIDKAWTYQPTRLWLHTCNLDHPVALPTYLKAGFKVYKEEMKKSEILG
jgi:GNAT superfamily N-acetyltransferase